MPSLYETSRFDTNMDTPPNYARLPRRTEAS
jgi:hypothetical protein